MRKVKLELTAKVPSWDFCNHDKLNVSPVPTKELCQFCKTERGIRVCTVFNEVLGEKGGLIDKTAKCIKLTQSFGGQADVAEPLEISPKDIVREAINLYSKTYNDLLNQGYPRELAEKFAKQHIERG